jgi:hypothetical protein
VSTETDAIVIATYADESLPLATAALPDEYRYQSLPLCVIDAVFSIGVRYNGTRRVVQRYCDYTNQRRIRPNEALPPVSEQEAVGVFCDRPEHADPAAMADQVYRCRQRTSTKSGILKAEAVTRFAACLRNQGVEFFQDVPRVADSARFEAEIRAIPGQGSGISLQYFWMLAGSDEFVKPDRMVLRFLQAALERSVSVREALPLMRAACQRLADKYPLLTPRLLDYEVWKYQREAPSAPT